MSNNSGATKGAKKEEGYVKGWRLDETDTLRMNETESSGGSFCCSVFIS